MTASLDLVILAAGISTRFGGGKALAEVGPNGEALFDYAIHDAHRAGFRRFVFVIQDGQEPDFRAHFQEVWSDAVEPVFVRQEAPSPPRTRPWGTGHAVLSVKGVVHGPFAVINGDDWYGQTGYRMLARHLADTVASTMPTHAAVTYPLRVTPMSRSGGVSRAICEVDANDYLRSVTEIKDIQPSGQGYVGRSASGDVVVLDGTESSSMNQWGFHVPILRPLQRRFQRFRERAAADEEFRIGEAINDAMSARECAVVALPCDESGLGITFRDDVDAVARHLLHLTEQGRYPPSLRDGI